MSSQTQISFYVGDDQRVYRKVTRDLSGITVVTSDVAIAPDVDTFRIAHPREPLTGAVRPERSLKDALEGADDAALARLGFQRIPQDEPSDAKRPGDDIEEDFPRHEGSGWYRLSNGERVRGRVSAENEQAALDSQDLAREARVEEFEEAEPGEAGNPDESEE